MSVDPRSAQLPAGVQAALSRLPPPLQDVFGQVLAAVGPLLAVEATEADTAAAVAGLAADGAAAEVARSGRVVEALAQAREREMARWDATFSALERGDVETLDELATSAGLWFETPDGPAISLGDGSVVVAKAGRICRIPQADDATGPAELVAGRWADGKPAQLLSHAAAALATCLAARKAAGPSPELLPLWLTVGVAVKPEDGSLPVKTLIRTVQQLRSVRALDQAAAPLLLLAFEISRLRATMRPVSGDRQVSGGIDVGRVRWCNLSQRPIFWLPMFGEHPDTIGGADRAWTTDLPAAGATWLATSPALQTDPSWSASLVIVPGNSNIWCVDRAGRRWSLETDYEAILLARHSHRDAWCDAVDWMHSALPAQIQLAEQRSADLAELRKRGPATASANQGARPHPADSSGPPTERPDRYSREWVEDLAGRYSYQDDHAAQAAGAAAARRGSYTRDEFLTIVRWKSQRALSRAERNSAARVETMTRQAFDTTNEVTRAAALVSLDGVGIPVASALLQFAFPDRYPILDFRALEALGDSRRRTTYSETFWADYVERCRHLAEDAGVSIRDLDKALWQASKDGDLPT